MGLYRQTAAPDSLREIGIFAAVLAIYFVVLNITFNVHSQQWEFAWGFPVELIAGFGLVAVSVILQRWYDGLRVLATAIVVLAVGFHVIDTAGRAIHGRRLDLVFDSAQFPHIIDLLSASLPIWLVWSGVILVLLVLMAVIAGTAFAFARLYRQFASALTLFSAPRIAAVFVIATGLLGLLDSNAMLADRPVFTSSQGTDAARYHVETVYIWVDGGKSALDEVTGDRNGIRDGETTLPGLRNTDVILIFVESYAASLYERESHLATMTDLYDRYGEKFGKKGIHTASVLMDSPTYGGLSWLAHLTLTSGARLERNLTYRAYLNSEFDTLQSILGRTGHHTVLLKPGIKRFWPEGARLRFDRVDTAEDIPYSGPDFGYFAIPDQVSLAHLASILETERPDPVLAQIALISSHYPFRPMPPFIADPARLDDPAAWDAAIAARNEAEDWQEPVEGYRRAIAYALESVLDFVDRTIDDNDLVIVLGDHQPWRVVSGNLGGRATPLHVFSRNRALVDAFLSGGYTNGLMPDLTADPIPMETFLPRLVHRFGDGAS